MIVSLGVCGTALMAGLVAASSPATQPAKAQQTKAPQTKAAPVTYSERQLRLALYPCQDCHRLIAAGPGKSGLSRPGKYHYQIDYRHFHHGGDDAPAKDAELGEHHRATCFVCHNATDRNQLRLPTSAGGATVPFNASYRQCLSCHGDKKADYEAGIHGKDIGGYGRAERIRFQCVDCHNPHSPKIKPMTALKPPKKPATLIPKKAHH